MKLARHSSVPGRFRITKDIGDVHGVMSVTTAALLALTVAAVPLQFGGGLLWLAIVFFVLAIIAAVAGFRGVAGLTMEIARILVIVFVILAIIALLF